MIPTVKIESLAKMHVYIDYLHEQLKHHHNPSFFVIGCSLHVAPFVDARSIHGDKKLLQHAINLRYLRYQRLRRPTTLNQHEYKISLIRQARDLIKMLSRATIVNFFFDKNDNLSSFTYFLPHHSMRRIYLFHYPSDVQSILSHYLIKHL